jgi:hypothetical protein
MSRSKCPGPDDGVALQADIDSNGQPQRHLQWRHQGAPRHVRRGAATPWLRRGIEGRQVGGPRGANPTCANARTTCTNRLILLLRSQLQHALKVDDAGRWSVELSAPSQLASPLLRLDISSSVHPSPSTETLRAPELQTRTERATGGKQPVDTRCRNTRWR